MFKKYSIIVFPLIIIIVSLFNVDFEVYKVYEIKNQELLKVLKENSVNYEPTVSFRNLKITLMSGLISLAGQAILIRLLLIDLSSAEDK